MCTVGFSGYLIFSFVLLIKISPSLLLWISVLNEVKLSTEFELDSTIEGNIHIPCWSRFYSSRIHRRFSESSITLWTKCPIGEVHKRKPALIVNSRAAPIWNRWCAYMSWVFMSKSWAKPFIRLYSQPQTLGKPWRFRRDYHYAAGTHIHSRSWACIKAMIRFGALFRSTHSREFRNKTQSYG